jgi:hypothetical protein
LRKIGQRGRKVGSVFHLRNGSGLVSHGTAHIQQKVNVGIGFAFVLFDVITIGSCKNLPVDASDIVSGHVLPVFGKVDTETEVGGLVKTGDKPLHDSPSNQL